MQISLLAHLCIFCKIRTNKTASPGAENLRCHPLWGTMATLYVLRLVITDYQLAPLIPATIVAPLLCKKNSIQLAKISKNLRKKGEKCAFLQTKAIRTFSTNVVYLPFKPAFSIFFYTEPFIVIHFSVMSSLNAPDQDFRVLS